MDAPLRIGLIGCGHFGGYLARAALGTGRFRLAACADAQTGRAGQLAAELGMTNDQVLDLCGVLGVPVKAATSSLNEAYADMVRRRAKRDGLTREHQPPKAVAGRR